ncbi:hypothetical protein [Actinotalea sp. JY-7876]|uniref:hypothetical protein n=1 Tax=Actinotalea sp. JY-7876 TaxID=2758442 RepID=UPI0015F69F0F|nr:hypothetical protein [Actinotalea sp. JY-7876]
MAQLSTAIRSAATMPRDELVASAHQRLASLARIHGASSPQVAAATARWGKLVDKTAARDDLMDLIEATSGGRR